MYMLQSLHTLNQNSTFIQAAEGAIGNVGWLWVLVFLLIVIVVWSRLVQPVETPDLHVAHDEHGEHEAPGEEEMAAEEEAIEEVTAGADEPEAEEAQPPAAVEPAPPAEPDDLTKLEGIGPKVQEQLRLAGITTYAELAETDLQKLDEIMDAAGLHFADESTWPEQAKLAAAGDWEGLEKLTSELKGGRRAPDDLTKLEGIGPKIQSVLNQAGIDTFAQLAETDPKRLDEILDAAGLHFADEATWPEQAKLAAAGDWEGLEKLTSELKGGRRAS